LSIVPDLDACPATRRWLVNYVSLRWRRGEIYFSIGVIGSKVLLTKTIRFFVLPPNGPVYDVTLASAVTPKLGNLTTISLNSRDVPPGAEQLVHNLLLASHPTLILKLPDTVREVARPLAVIYPSVVSTSYPSGPQAIQGNCLIDAIGWR
jgi:hypothetical protein